MLIFTLYVGLTGSLAPCGWHLLEAWQAHFWQMYHAKWTLSVWYILICLISWLVCYNFNDTILWHFIVYNKSVALARTKWKTFHKTHLFFLWRHGGISNAFVITCKNGWEPLPLMQTISEKKKKKVLKLRWLKWVLNTFSVEAVIYMIVVALRSIKLIIFLG